MSLKGKIQFAELTDTGKVRDHNEDAIGSDDDMGLVVLADGMGGYNAGEVASGIAVQTITELASEGALREERNDLDPTTGLMRQSIVLRDAVSRALDAQVAPYRRGPIRHGPFPPFSHGRSKPLSKQFLVDGPLTKSGRTRDLLSAARRPR